MSVDEIVDVGVRLHVLFGVAHERLLVFALVGWLLPVGAFHAAVLRPCQPEPYAPAWVKGAEHALAGAVVEHAAYEVELRVVVAEAVAVGQVEYLSVYFRGYGLCVQRHSAFLFEVVVCPDVVVAGEEMHLDAHVSQFRQLAEEARVALGHNVLVLVPEVEDVS